MNEFILSLFLADDKLKKTTLYQVLVGKRSSSVISFAFFHDLLPLLSVLPSLRQEDFEKRLTDLKKQEKITEEQLELVVRQADHEFLLAQEDFQALNYFRFGRKEEQSWRLVRFLVQVASFLGKKKDYIPLENSIAYTERIRQLVYHYGQALPDLLKKELYLIFSALNKEQADFLAGSLAGFEQQGQAFFQMMPAKYKVFPWGQLYQSNAIHAFLNEVCQKRPQVLFSCLHEVLLQSGNQSMYQTRRLFLQGNDLAHVMQYRNLTKGTIQDHLIEWAIVDQNFPFTNFLPQATCQRLVHLPQSSFRYPFKELTEEFSASFLEIRLYQIWRKKQKIC